MKKYIRHLGQLNPIHDTHKMPRSLLAGRTNFYTKGCNSEQSQKAVEWHQAPHIIPSSL
jgi:hypothetical protein